MSALDNVAPNAGIRGLRAMIAPPPAMVSNRESSGRADIASRDACAAGFTGRFAALGPSPAPAGPWQDAHHFAYSAAPSGVPGAGGAAGRESATSASGASPGSDVRYLVTSSSCAAGMRVRGMTVPGTTCCGIAIIDAM